MVRGVDADRTPLPAERARLVFFRGHCGPWENVAKRMRHAMVGALRQGNTSDVDACCLGALLRRSSEVHPLQAGPSRMASLWRPSRAF